MTLNFPASALRGIARHYVPDEIWMFESCTTGIHRDECDWNILVLVAHDADKVHRSATQGSEICRRHGITVNVHCVESDIFHASSKVPNSLARSIGDDRILLYRREAYVPAPISQPQAFAFALRRWLDDAQDYLRAASMMSTITYGRLRLLGLASESLIKARLTADGIHLEVEMSLPDMARAMRASYVSPDIVDGLAFVDAILSCDISDAHEYMTAPSNRHVEILGRLQEALGLLARGFDQVETDAA